MATKVRVIAASTAAAALFLGVVGCSSGTPSTPASSGAAEKPSGVLTTYLSTSQQAGYEAVFKLFNQEYPDVTIQPQWVVGGSSDAAAALLAQLNSGGGPDIFNTYAGNLGPTSIGNLGPGGSLADLSDQPWVADLPDNIREASTLDGKVGVQVIGIGTGAVLFNGDMLKQMGLKDPTSFPELLQLCKDSRSKNPNLIPMSFGVKTSGFAAFVGAEIAATTVYAQDPDWNQKRLDGKVTFANSKWPDALNQFKQMQDAGCFSPGLAGDDVPTMYQQVPSGQALGSIGITSAMGAIVNAAPNVDWHISPYPFATKDATQLIIRPNTTLSVNANSQNLTAALAFSEFMGRPSTLDAMWKATGYSELPPSVFTSGQGWPDLYKTLKTYQPKPQIIDPELAWPTQATANKLAEGVQGILTGQLTPQQVAANLDASWNQK